MTDPRAVPPEVREFLQPEALRGQPREHVARARAGVDRYSETWRVAAGYARAEIEDLRDALETPGLGAVETEALRGQILALRNFLSIGEADQARSTDRQNLRAGY